MSATRIDIGKAVREYCRLRAHLPVGPLRTRSDYGRAVKTLDALLDAIGEDERHVAADLAETIGMFIERYEREHVAPPAARPADVLRFLMEQNGLRQADLPEIGSQGVVSEILSGRRKLNARQIRRLAGRFGISPAVLLE